MKAEDLTFFDPWGEIGTTKNRLPHWQQTGATYFVTWRLADSLPKTLLDQHFEDRATWLQQHPEPWDKDIENEYHRKFSTRLDDWMDSGHGSCPLRKQENAQIVRDAFLFFEGKRTLGIAIVIMPNHVHSLFSLHSGEDLSKIVHSWKRHSARKINLRKNRLGPLWQKDYFDRLIRDRRHFENCVRYIRNNPLKGKLQKQQYLLYENEIAKGIE